MTNNIVSAKLYYSSDIAKYFFSTIEARWLLRD